MATTGLTLLGELYGGLAGSGSEIARIRQGRKSPHQVASFKSGQFRVRAIVFDLDGVLIDTMPELRAVWAEWAIAHGISAETVLSYIHLTASELIVKFTPTLDIASETRAIAIRLATLRTKVTAFDGSRELIAALPPANWAIVTSARREPAMRHLEMAGLPAPRVLISAEDTPRGKPDPRGYLLAAERLQVLPTACLAIEDSPAGLQAAFWAGMVTIAITNTHDAIELRPAHNVIGSLRDLKVKLDAADILTVTI